MLKVVRARRSVVAAALLVSLVSLSLPHVGDAHHDPDGPMVVFAHDPSAHTLRANGTDNGALPPHCVVCHLARSFRLRTESHVLPAPPVAAGVRVHIDISTAARPAPVAQPPLRSPPIPPVLA